jgi:hypothetical protein
MDDLVPVPSVLCCSQNLVEEKNRYEKAVGQKNRSTNSIAK